MVGDARRFAGRGRQRNENARGTPVPLRPSTPSARGRFSRGSGQELEGFLCDGGRGETRTIRVASQAPVENREGGRSTAKRAGSGGEDAPGRPRLTRRYGQDQR